MIQAEFGNDLGLDWAQVGSLGLAFVLSAAIGFEREIRNKSAGLRTHTIIGFATALLMLVSAYGFSDLIGESAYRDPMRIAAQIVSGIGFIGGGLIFVRRDAVRGLTTAASVWLTTSVGMAAGAGLPLLAIVVTLGYFIIIFGLTPLAGLLSRGKHTPVQVRLVYDEESHGVLRRALAECTGRGFKVITLATQQHAKNESTNGDTSYDQHRRRTVSVVISVQGGDSLPDLLAVLSEQPGIISVSSGRNYDESID